MKMLNAEIMSFENGVRYLNEYQIFSRLLLRFQIYLQGLQRFVKGDFSSAIFLCVTSR